MAALGLFALILLASRGVMRRHAMTAWRASLGSPAERLEWPPPDPQWPPYPTRSQPTGGRMLEAAGPAVVRSAARRHHASHPVLLRDVPPTHESNLNCYESKFGPDGIPIWTDHALSCRICISITREVMLMVRRGWSPRTIRETIDREYTRAGYHLSTRTSGPSTTPR